MIIRDQIYMIMITIGQMPALAQAALERKYISLESQYRPVDWNLMLCVEQQLERLCKYAVGAVSLTIPFRGL